jgi:hypothetical protein
MSFFPLLTGQFAGKAYRKKRVSTIMKAENN